ncbi:hypothetical protein KIPB_001456 [Kipferlia bialata]|uniref:Uncharacterized protein n=1 Tax=Kipferlia bialata TaxID=797122 RepID=A0A9K3CNR5_9EUKA|nr:hypothetical protein KIPB_001456 [Kipferlia bialata]|eukprot:g1456.t1
MGQLLSDAPSIREGGLRLLTFFGAGESTPHPTSLPYMAPPLHQDGYFLLSVTHQLLSDMSDPVAVDMARHRPPSGADPLDHPSLILKRLSALLRVSRDVSGLEDCTPFDKEQVVLVRATLRGRPVSVFGAEDGRLGYLFVRHTSAQGGGTVSRQEAQALTGLVVMAVRFLVGSDLHLRARLGLSDEGLEEAHKCYKSISGEVVPLVDKYLLDNSGRALAIRSTPYLRTGASSYPFLQADALLRHVSGLSSRLKVQAAVVYRGRVVSSNMPPHVAQLCLLVGSNTRGNRALVCWRPVYAEVGGRDGQVGGPRAPMGGSVQTSGGEGEGGSVTPPGDGQLRRVLRHEECMLICVNPSPDTDFDTQAALLLLCQPIKGKGRGGEGERDTGDKGDDTIDGKGAIASQGQEDGEDKGTVGDGPEDVDNIALPETEESADALTPPPSPPPSLAVDEDGLVEILLLLESERLRMALNSLRDTLRESYPNVCPFFCVPPAPVSCELVETITFASHSHRNRSGSAQRKDRLGPLKGAVWGSVYKGRAASGIGSAVLASAREGHGRRRRQETVTTYARSVPLTAPMGLGSPAPVAQDISVGTKQGGTWVGQDVEDTGDTRKTKGEGDGEWRVAQAQGEVWVSVEGEGCQLMAYTAEGATQSVDRGQTHALTAVVGACQELHSGLVHGSL